jgi:hypothetical protein
LTIRPTCVSCLGVGFEAQTMSERGEPSHRCRSDLGICNGEWAVYIKRQSPGLPAICNSSSIYLILLYSISTKRPLERPASISVINVRPAPCFREQRCQHPDTHNQSRSINSSVFVPRIIRQSKNTWVMLIKLVDQPYLTSVVPYIFPLVNSLGKQSGLS